MLKINSGSYAEQILGIRQAGEGLIATVYELQVRTRTIPTHLVRGDHQNSANTPPRAKKGGDALKASIELIGIQMTGTW